LGIKKMLVISYHTVKLACKGRINKKENRLKKDSPGAGDKGSLFVVF